MTDSHCACTEIVHFPLNVTETTNEFAADLKQRLSGRRKLVCDFCLASDKVESNLIANTNRAFCFTYGWFTLNFRMQSFFGKLRQHSSLTLFQVLCKILVLSHLEKQLDCVEMGDPSNVSIKAFATVSGGSGTSRNKGPDI